MKNELSYFSGVYSITIDGLLFVMMESNPSLVSHT